MNKKFLLIYFLSILTTNFLFAQKTKEELEAERISNARKIEETNKILQLTQKDKKASLQKLTVVLQQINQNALLIVNLAESVKILDDDLKNAQDVVNALEADLADLKKEYSEMIYFSYKTNSPYDRLSFLFSAKTINQLLTRAQYFTQYTEVRKNQIIQIEKVKEMLARKQTEIELKRSEHAKLLTVEQSATASLRELKKEHDVLVTSLKNKEKQLLAELEASKKQLAEMNKQISQVSGEISDSLNTAKANSAYNFKETPDGEAGGGDFASYKGKLIWPVKDGIVVSKFGVQQHPILKNITSENLGIDIRTYPGEPVRAVFDGVVTHVAQIDGINYFVMIQHGRYYSIYARLKSVNVKVGEKVKIKEKIGIVDETSEGIAELQFQIWRNQDKLDPEGWLAK